MTIMKFPAAIAIAFTLWLASTSFRAEAQAGAAGSISVTVQDPTGSLIPNAVLELRDQGTNEVRKAVTSTSGSYTFPNLPFGLYELAVTANGFKRQVFSSVQVQTARATEIAATLQLGGATETVEVTGAAPLLESTSSTVATTIDTKQVVNLPIQGRNVFNLAFTTPGFSSTPLAVVSQTTLSQGPQDNTIPTSGTYNNLPGGAIVGATLDGVPGISGRFKSAGFQYGTVVVQPRLENIAEMTVQTSQMDLSGGGGTSSLQISLVTRRGTNEFHGRIFEDFRNTDLNANTWINNALRLPRNVIKLNDFGGSVGGPILKNKLFFYAAMAESIAPLTRVSNATVLSPAAQQGNFSYKISSGGLQTVNVLQLAGAAGYPAAVLPNISGQFSKINGILSTGTLTPTSDPNLYTLNFVEPARQTIKYPVLRLDYSISDTKHVSLVYNQTATTCVNCNAPAWPGGINTLESDAGSVNPNNRIISLSYDWSIRPSIINQFHAGYTGQKSVFNPENQAIDLSNAYTESWAYGQSVAALGRLKVSSFYPLLSANDSLLWQKGTHSLTMGGTWWREQDHYWNSPSGYPRYTFGVNSLDPVSTVFTSALSSAGTTPLANAEALYATLAGRISAVSTTRPLDFGSKQYKPFGEYDLDEVQQSAGFFLQDRWRVSSSLTLNYGLRWEIIGDDHDIHGDYTSSRSVADLWGPTTLGVSFQPGALAGVQDPQMIAAVHHYNTSWVNPQPAFAVAWNPKTGGGRLGKIFGSGDTVIRAGYSMRVYDEGQQNFWAFGSSSGAFFYQSLALTPTTAPGLGNFIPGSLAFGDPLPAYFGTPATWQPQISQSATTFTSTTPWGFNPNIRSPYVEEFNVSLQHQIGRSSAFEIRYAGNVAMHVWDAYNINEVNIFENGFLNEFTNAQRNLAVNVANGKGNSFANNGLAGQFALPIMTAAFGSPTGSNYTNGSFITYLQTGAAGAMANNIAGNQAFVCNMFGAKFTPCAARGFTGAGAGYPINFWQVNPFATGRAVNYEDSSGHSNYNGLQTEFRQRLTDGIQFNFNYTFSHSMGLLSQNAIQGQATGASLYYTNRNFRLNYAPSAFDIRHVLHFSGTFDLPFGKNRRFLNTNKVADEVIGGWTLGTIITFQTGTPVVLNGGYLTMNEKDPGVVFQNGLTVSQLQSSVGVYHGGSPWAYFIDPKYVASNGQANYASIAPESTPGQFGYHPYLYGPHWFGGDLSLNKAFPIREHVRATFQAECLNLLNHPTWGPVTSGASTANVQALTFGQTTGGSTGPRVIEFRLNVEF
ncbi:MAG TPA: carboxypeptidase-like regulatory domain-containing protein [Candidatus Limnocylindrales bacterium]|nr:carboxypeptidase-like regulatory domain-containing protein [Candidatus Limnocylindrales bacterium]